MKLLLPLRRDAGTFEETNGERKAKALDVSAREQRQRDRTGKDKARRKGTDGSKQGILQKI